MSEIVAEATNYDELIEAFRAIKAHRGLSDASVDDLAGLTRGHTGKILGPSQDKGLSRMTFDILLGVFAVKLVMVIDEEAEKRIAARWDRRDEGRVRVDASRVSMKLLERAKPAIYKAQMKHAASVRNSKLSPKQRSKIASKAARARWRKARRREVKSPPLAPT